MKFRFAFFFASSLVLAGPASAYGPIGHQIIGAVADERLANTPTGSKVHLFLDGLTLQKASVIPDEIKGWDKNGPDAPGIFHYTSRPRIDAQLTDYWKANPPTHDRNAPTPSHHWFHYTDVSVITPQHYADGRAGRSQWDIVHAMRYCIAVLKGEEPEQNARKVTKSIAVILLAHFVGDIHEPLHVGAEYFNNRGDVVDPDKEASALEDQGGNALVLRHSAAAAAKLGHRTSNLHGFWDDQAVAANLPETLKTMAKEERRKIRDEARTALVRQFAAEVPAHWRVPADIPVNSYPEAWANEILPLAREAHERLRFFEVAPKQENGEMFAAGYAEQKPGDVSYEDWAAKIVHDELHSAGWRLADLLEKALQ